MKIITKDDQIIEISQKTIEKCKLLNDLKLLTIIKDPVNLQITSKCIKFISEFANTDNGVLIENYDPLRIYFSPEQLAKFGDLEEDFLIELSTGANYLDYPFLLELCCRTIAEKLKTQPIEKIKDYLQPMDDDNDEFSWVSSEDKN